MVKINSATDLHNAILELETTFIEEGEELKEEFHHAYEGIKPINLIKRSLTEIAHSQDLKDNLLNAGLGLTLGYISKALFEEVSHSPLRKLIGTVLMFGITSTITQNPEVVKAMAKGVMDVIKRQ